MQKKSLKVFMIMEQYDHDRDDKDKMNGNVFSSLQWQRNETVPFQQTDHPDQPIKRRRIPTPNSCL